jgi:MoxR-like ATPase
MSYYFKLVEQAAKLVCVPLDGQLISTPTISAPTGELKPLTGIIAFDNPDVLSNYNVGSIFVTDSLVLIAVNKYGIKADAPVHLLSDPKLSIKDKTVKPPFPPATDKIREDYSKFLASLSFDPDEPDEPEEKKRDTILHKIKAKNTPPDKSEFVIAKNVWYYLIHQTMYCKNILLTGPTGTGKTKLVSVLAKSLNKKLYYFDMSTMVDPIVGLIGSHRIIKDEETGASVSSFDFARFAKAIQEDCIILLDELSRAAPYANNILLPVLDERRTLYTDMASSTDARTIQVNEDCLFIATANIGAEYVGTNTLDRAIDDRFTTRIELKYMSVDEETELLQARYPTVKPKDIRVITEVAGRTRLAYSNGEIQTCISPRFTDEATALVDHGFTTLEAMELTFLTLFDEGTGDDGERTTVRSIMSGF